MAFGGTFVSTDPPQRSGLFINVETVASTPIRDVAQGRMGLVVKADWGPINTITEIGDLSQVVPTFWTGQTANFAITSALLGEGVPGRFGATTVLVYRAAVAGTAAMASATLQNTTPATALTLTAKYHGTRANNFFVTVQTNAIDGTKKDVLILEGTTLLETFTWLATDVAGMAALINANSDYVTAVSNISGVALAVVSNTAFTGGNSGLTLTTTEHTNAQNAFEADGSFDVFAVDDLPDDTSSIRTSYKNWCIRLNGEGKLFTMITGGLSAELTTTATARAADHNSEYMVTLYGDLSDDTTGIQYTSSKMAPRVGGILAGAGVQRSITAAQIDGMSLVSPPTNTQIETLVRAGVVPFIKDASDVRLQRARTTYQATGANANARFKSLLFMRRLQYTFRRFDLITSQNIFGQNISNTPQGRQNILDMFKGELASLEASGYTIPDATVQLDGSQDNTGETLWLIFVYRPATGVEQILGRVQIAP